MEIKKALRVELAEGCFLRFQRKLGRHDQHDLPGGGVSVMDVFQIPADAVEAKFQQIGVGAGGVEVQHITDSVR